MLDVLDDWSKYYDESKQIDNIYLDIKKAFYTIPHDIPFTFIENKKVRF